MFDWMLMDSFELYNRRAVHVVKLLLTKVGSKFRSRAATFSTRVQTPYNSRNFLKPGVEFRYTLLLIR
jgi:hypothetical protein